MFKLICCKKTTSVKEFSMDYSMFSDVGNAMIHGIVTGARHKNLTWPEVYTMLETVSKIDGFGEATDTEVRECVYAACGFKTGFYC
jgi:hypothetical protein